MIQDKKKRIWIAAGLLLLLAGFAAGIWKYIGGPLTRFISDPAFFRAWVEERGWYSRLVFVGMVIFQVIIAFIPGEPFEIAAGYAFGALEGTLLSIAGTAIGSVITFWLVRRFGLRLVRLFFSQEQINSVKFLKTTNTRNFLFLMIYTPFSPGP